MREFILGLGTQKAGTSWLYEQLTRQKRFKEGFTKEYHVFDALHLPSCRPFMTRIEKKAADQIQKGYQRYKNSPAIKKLGFYADPDLYFQYFDNLLDEDDCFSADITPPYCGLPSEVLHHIKERFARDGITVKVVFLMREPLTRIESAIRHLLRKKEKISTTSDQGALKMLHTFALSGPDKLRADYAYTTGEVRKVFAEENTYFGFFETMFEDGEISRLAEFLSINPGDLDTGSKVNSTPISFRYPESELNHFVEEYSKTYDFVAREFGFDLAIWKSAVKQITA